ncbi:MAG: polyprenyl synthetase family protein [Actinomycetota bacterium]
MTSPTAHHHRFDVSMAPVDTNATMEDHLEAAMADQPDAIRATLAPIAAGGKRTRARMVRLASRAGTVAPPPHRLEALAASVELLHLATLVHDDVIDGDLERRGHPTLFASFDEGTSIVAGDRIIGSAFQLTSSISGTCAAGMARCLMALCDGQQHEELCVQAGEWTADDYWRSVDGKTASLFTFALVAGAELGQADATTLGALQDFGMAYGRAYQLADDLVDLPSTPPGRQLVRALAPSQSSEPFGLGGSLSPLADLSAHLFGDALAAASLLSGEPAEVFTALAEAGRAQAHRLAEELG